MTTSGYHSEMVGDVVPAPRALAARQSVLGFLATSLATGFGAGFSPIAPGTAGTVVGLLLFWPMARWPFAYQVAATIVLFALGVPAATHVARRVARKDPGLVVVDEMIGMWISLLLLPWTPAVVVAS